MNHYIQLALKAARHLYFKKRHLGSIPASAAYWDSERAPAILASVVQSETPYMIARIGATELGFLSNHYVNKHGWSAWSYIQGKQPIPIRDEAIWQKKLCIFSGFFPAERTDLGERFYKMMLEDLNELDILGSWLSYEDLFVKLPPERKVHICNLEPFDDSGKPWSKYLAGKRVLVIHPFAETIESQYHNKRELLFENKDVLPEFHLQTIKAIQSLGGEAPEGMETWFDALEHMKQQIDACDYDVCLLGCGAYGFPLAAHIKRQGKQAIHMGGSLQLLFGIKGKRWVEQYGSDERNPYLKLFNEHWVYPDEADKPKAAARIEDACYW